MTSSDFSTHAYYSMKGFNVLVAAILAVIFIIAVSVVSRLILSAKNYSRGVD